MLNWWLPRDVSTFGGEIDSLFHIIYWITGATFFAVQIALLVFVFRYRHRPADARIALVGTDALRVLFDQAQRAVTPGQAAVFYDGDQVLGGGRIERALSSTDQAQ